MIWLVIGVILFTFMIIAGLLGFLIHHWWFSKDRADLAWIFVDAGNNYNPKKGKLRDVTTDGLSYVYGENVLHVPVDPKRFPFKFFKHRRVLVVKDGNLIASALGNTDIPDTKFDPAVKQKSLVKDLTLSHIGSDMVTAMSGKGVSIWLIAIIGVVIVVVVVGGVFLFQQSQKNKQAVMPTTPAQSTQLPPSGGLR